MSPLRCSLFVTTIALASLTACSKAQTPPSDSQRAANQAQAAAQQAVDAAPAVSTSAAELDSQLAELGWAGAAATTYAYAEACGASTDVLAGFKQAQREQAATMGSDAAKFDSRFPAALELAQQRVQIDDIGMSDAHRADTCKTTLGYPK